MRSDSSKQAKARAGEQGSKGRKDQRERQKNRPGQKRARERGVRRGKKGRHGGTKTKTLGSKMAQAGPAERNQGLEGRVKVER